MNTETLHLQFGTFFLILGTKPYSFKVAMLVYFSRLLNVEGLITQEPEFCDRTNSQES